MKIHFFGQTDLRAVDSFLQHERECRVLSPQRETCEDFAVVYEPKEAFSIAKQRDLPSIRSATARDFWVYVNARHIPIITMRRGGGMIWHGPGQVVLAPLVDLYRLSFSNVPHYSAMLEETCMRTLKAFGINGVRNHYRPGSQGAWAEVALPSGREFRKIAFFGWSNSRGIAIHGCAINVAPDLHPFSFIDPCNLPDVAVTSMQELMPIAPDLHDVARVLAETFSALITPHYKTPLEVCSPKRMPASSSIQPTP